MRLDRLLFNLRFAKSRTLAQRWIAEGHIRRNGARVMRQDCAIAPGDVLTLPLPRRVIVVEVVALPARRGPPAEARACWRNLSESQPEKGLALDAGAAIPIAGAPAMSGIAASATGGGIKDKESVKP